MAAAEPVKSLLNLGPQSSRWLREAGFRTVDDVRRLGPAAVYRLVKRSQPKASRNLLWALAAGLEGRDWRSLTDAEKTRLWQEAERDD